MSKLIIGDQDSELISPIEQSPPIIPFSPGDPLSSGFGVVYSLLFRPLKPKITYASQNLGSSSLNGNNVIVGDVSNFSMVAVGNAHFLSELGPTFYHDAATDTDVQILAHGAYAPF